MRRRLLLSTLLGPMVVGLGACAIRPEPNASLAEPFDTHDADAVAQRDSGLALRAAIDHVYWTSASSEASQRELMRAVSEHLPAGIRFDRAERILRYAGFELSSGDLGNFPFRYAVIAPYVDSFPILRLGITLYPTARPPHVADSGPVDWSKVMRVDAAFYRIWP